MRDGGNLSRVKRLFDAIEHRLDAPIVDGRDEERPDDAHATRQPRLDRVHQHRAVGGRSEIKAVPPMGAGAVDQDSPTLAVPRLKRKREAPVPDARDIRNEGERVGLRRVLPPAPQDVARERVAVGPAPCGLDPRPDEFDRSAELACVDVLHRAAFIYLSLRSAPIDRRHRLNVRTSRSSTPDLEVFQMFERPCRLQVPHMSGSARPNRSTGAGCAAVRVGVEWHL
jgi:hypothetical protein